MVPLTIEESKSHRKQKTCYIYKKGFSLMMILKNILKPEINVIILVNIEDLLIIFVI